MIGRVSRHSLIKEIKTYAKHSNSTQQKDIQNVTL